VSKRGVLQVVLVTIFLGIGAFFLSLDSDHGDKISGFDTAQIQSVCGGATPCTCGDELTSSRTLTASDNLTGCTTVTALTVNASHVVLDCGTFMISGAGAARGVLINSSSENITIRNCNIHNFTGHAIYMNGVGNNSFIQNNNLSDFNSTATAIGILLTGGVNNVTIVDNRFNVTSKTTSQGIRITGATNITIRNNTFGALGAAFNLGSPTILTANVSISANNYVAPTSGITMADGLYANNTFRDENLSGGPGALRFGYSDGNFTNHFINVTFLMRVNKTLSVLAGNATFAYTDNESSNVYLGTRVNGSGLSFQRQVFNWTAFNVSIQENFSAPAEVNYTLLTNRTGSGVLIYVNGQLNRSVTFNSQGDISHTLVFLNDSRTNISFIVDVLAPNMTVVSPNESNFSSGTTQVLLNVSTNENSTCRYDTSDVTFGSMANTLNSTSNFTHTSNFTSLTDGTNYSFYVKCQDLVSNVQNATVNFSILSAAAAAPSPSGGGGAAAAAEENVTVIEEEEEEEAAAEPEAAAAQEEEEAAVGAPARAPGEQREVSRAGAPFFEFLADNWWLLAGIAALSIVGLLLLFAIRRKGAVAPVEMPRSRTMREYYQIFTALKKKYDEGDAQAKREASYVLEQFRNIFETSWLMSSTTIHYQSDSLFTSIVHGAVQETLLALVYPFRPMTPYACEPACGEFLQAYFGTRDDYETIMQTLEFVSGKNRENIYLFTPTPLGRSKYPERIAGLDYYEGKFRISAAGLAHRPVES